MKPEKFDAQVFLAKMGGGKTILEFAKGQNVFEQGDVADTVYYIQKGRIKLTVLSDQGKEAVVGILEPGQFFGEGCLKTATSCGSRRQRRWNIASSRESRSRR